jgi:putative endonuclease
LRWRRRYEAGDELPVVILSAAKNQREAMSSADGHQRKYFVYVMSNRTRTLYVGITNDLVRRAFEHKHKLLKGFTARYSLDRLVYFDETTDVYEAIAREKQLKGWLRARKIALIESTNPRWQDLSRRWFDQNESLRADPSLRSG